HLHLRFLLSSHDRRHKPVMCHLRCACLHESSPADKPPAQGLLHCHSKMWPAGGTLGDVKQCAPRCRHTIAVALLGLFRRHDATMDDYLGREVSPECRWDDEVDTCRINIAEVMQRKRCLMRKDRLRLA